MVNLFLANIEWCVVGDPWPVKGDGGGGGLGTGAGDSHMSGAGMLAVSLRGVNFGFWSHLGCSGQNAIIFSSEGLV